MSDFAVSKTKNGFTCKLWRGERMCLLGFDVAEPEPDFVGFAIESKAPGDTDFSPLLNRIAFSYDSPSAVTGDRLFSSLDAPFQKFRWIHFPWNPQDGKYQYRVHTMHMNTNEKLRKGTSLSISMDLQQSTYGDFLDVGFTRNFASSQAYRSQFGNREDIIPANSEDGLNFNKIKLTNAQGESVYDWLGFEAKANLFAFLQNALADKDVKIEVMAYDLNEPDIVALLEKFKSRLRIIIDNSTSSEDGIQIGHGTANSPESTAAARLIKTAGAANVHRLKFGRYQHNKVFVTRRKGVAERVMCGSTNFTFRGLYIQANNVLIFNDSEVAGLFARMFDLAFNQPTEFKNDPFSRKWHSISKPGKPNVRICFSPHGNSSLSLNPVAAAIDQATSSVLYSVAFLNMMKSGPTYDAFGRLSGRDILSYGTVDQRGKLTLHKPDGSIGLVDFKYLSKKAPEPFKSEWSGGEGRNVHHKFVVTDFNLPTARVFTGSSNLSPSGETSNGDHLIMIEDQKIATAYAIEAVRVFDHLEFRNKMKAAEKIKAKKKGPVEPIKLRKPTAISGEPAWFERYYVQDSQRMRDRLIFSS